MDAPVVSKIYADVLSTHLNDVVAVRPHNCQAEYAEYPLPEVVPAFIAECWDAHVAVASCVTESKVVHYSFHMVLLMF